MTTEPQLNEQPDKPWLTYKRAMIVVAHPDDAEFGFGGTLCKLVKEGMELAYVLCTSGDKGSGDPTMTSGPPGPDTRGGAAGGERHHRHHRRYVPKIRRRGA